MDRATLKVSPRTAKRLRLAIPWLAIDAGRHLTIDQAINYLIDTWPGENLTPSARPAFRETLAELVGDGTS